MEQKMGTLVMVPPIFVQSSCSWAVYRGGPLTGGRHMAYWSPGSYTI